MVISGVGRGVSGERDWRLLLYEVKIYLVCGFMLKKKETTASNGWIGCNFKPFRGHKFMTPTKNDQFCDPWPPCPVPHSLNLQKWTIDLLFKNKRICRHMTNFKIPSYLTIPLLCGRLFVWTDVCYYMDFFSVLEKKSHPIVWTKTSQSSKNCLKTFLSHIIVDCKST